jgi:hypothetical protein
MDQKDIVDRLKKNVNRTSALETLIEVSGVLDSMNVFAYENWEDGEVVDGPAIERYWVTLTLMYPYKLMPNPDGAKRLIDAGCKVYYAKDTYVTAAKLKTPDDMEYDAMAPDGRPRAKKVERKVWLVTLEIPRQFMDSLVTDKVSIDDTTTDFDAVEQAYDQGLGDEDAIRS